MSRTNFDTLLEAGCHFGHLKRKWNQPPIMYQNLLLTLFLILIVYFLFCLLNQLPGSLSDKNLQEES